MDDGRRTRRAREQQIVTTKNTDSYVRGYLSKRGKIPLWRGLPIVSVMVPK